MIVILNLPCLFFSNVTKKWHNLLIINYNHKNQIIKNSKIVNGWLADTIGRKSSIFWNNVVFFTAIGKIIFLYFPLWFQLWILSSSISTFMLSVAFSSACLPARWWWRQVFMEQKSRKTISQHRFSSGRFTVMLAFLQLLDYFSSSRIGKNKCSSSCFYQLFFSFCKSVLFQNSTNYLKI